MHIHYIQHVSYEGPAQIITWAKDRGHQVTHSVLSKGEPLLNADEFDWLIVMGGPMSTYQEDKYSWLKPEKILIKEAIEKNKIVLGLCLGAQLIAEVLGAKVYPHKNKEIGWHPIQTTPEKNQSDVFKHWPNQLLPFHWHGDTFDLPEGCVRVGQTAACLNQAFYYKDRVFGLQFHLEFDEQMIKRLIERDRDQLMTGKYIQTEEEMLADKTRIVESNRILFDLLDRISQIVT